MPYASNVLSREKIYCVSKRYERGFFVPAAMKPRSSCVNVGCEEIKMSTLENFKSNRSIGSVETNEVRLDRTRIEYILQTRFFSGL